MADTTDLLNHAFEKNPVDFADTFNQLMQQKAQDAIEAHRVTLAQSIYGGEGVEQDVEETDDVDEVGDDADDDFEFSDDELEDFDDEDDLDLDLDDLDLEDLDLDDNEDFTDDQEDA